MVAVTDPSGERRTRSAATLAQAWLSNSPLTADVARGEYREQSRIGFDEYAAEWARTSQGRTAHGIPPLTVGGSARDLEAHAVPRLGRLRVTELAHRDIKRLVADPAEHRAASLYPADGNLTYPTKRATHIHPPNLRRRRSSNQRRSARGVRRRAPMPCAHLCLAPLHGGLTRPAGPDDVGTPLPTVHAVDLRSADPGRSTRARVRLTAGQAALRSRVPGCTYPSCSSAQHTRPAPVLVAREPTLGTQRVDPHPRAAQPVGGLGDRSTARERRGPPGRQSPRAL